MGVRFTTRRSTKFATLKSGLEYEELVDLVKQSLAIASQNVTLKMSYQYPSWMLIDDGDGSTPQFISDDHEVEVLVQMRRKIEEVNLCVTIAKCSDGLSTANRKPHFADVTDQNLCNTAAPISSITAATFALSAEIEFSHLKPH
ncbi:hypothetical protein HID58_073814 [Brassica napus]|uniref:PB1 domain-containing protein n=1 Tax=Brassica napus TaxID=3708 RepID=A0ABQ7YF61_BRANA|nr:hypothetical protein HID58_073814 [Brassica napus]